ncbi:hypothetical protein L0Z64_15535 [Phaeobacter sp. BS23]|uniref:hypothetical protein n=1 Tax=Phaeobacter sp. BS23 TaxID=2907239 RepID=UPI003864F8B3
MFKTLMTTTLAAGFAVAATVASADNYPAPVPLQDGAQASIDAIAPKNDTFRIAYMPLQQPSSTTTLPLAKASKL